MSSLPDALARLRCRADGHDTPFTVLDAYHVQAELTRLRALAEARPAGNDTAPPAEHNHLNSGVYGSCSACGTDWSLPLEVREDFDDDIDAAIRIAQADVEAKAPAWRTVRALLSEITRRRCEAEALRDAGDELAAATCELTERPETWTAEQWDRASEAAQAWRLATRSAS